MKTFLKASTQGNLKSSFSRPFILTIACLLILGGCTKKNDPLPETERVKGILKANTWTMQTVTVDQIDQSALYAGLTLSFTESNYSSTNGGLVWPSSGSWSFADQTGKVLTRNDGLPITVEDANATKLVLKFTWMKTTLSGGKVSSLAGVHIFTFGK